MNHLTIERVIWQLEAALSWRQDYTVEVNAGLVQVRDNRLGYFMSVVSGSQSEIDYIVEAVKSWRKGTPTKPMAIAWDRGKGAR